jgi:chlorite dismutase
MGAFLETPFSYVAMTKRSMYVGEHTHPGQEGTRTRVKPGKAKYLFVYPFWKTRPWYQLPLEERQAMMSEHIRVGHTYPSVKINTAYSFGLDDPEFVVAFETDVPADFLDLVMELRESAASSYTLRDTPIFTCLWMQPGEALDAIG